MTKLPRDHNMITQTQWPSAVHILVGTVHAQYHGSTTEVPEVTAHVSHIHDQPQLNHTAVAAPSPSPSHLGYPAADQRYDSVYQSKAREGKHSPGIVHVAEVPLVRGVR